MSRGSEVYLRDILEASEKIRRYSAGLSQAGLAADSMVYDAIVRNLEIIGEAAKNIPEEVRSANLTVDWKRISGLRDILVHEYFGIDNEILWDIIANKIPVLEAQIRKILGPDVSG